MECMLLLSLFGIFELTLSRIQKRRKEHGLPLEGICFYKVKIKIFMHRVFFYTGPPPKSLKYKKVSRSTIYVNVDSPGIS